MATATIDKKIETAYKKSEEIYNKPFTWQEKVDELLDRMNALNKMLTTLQGVLLKITFEIERDMDGFKQSQMAPDAIRKLVSVSARILNIVHKSDLYPGVKTTYHALKQEVSYLNELAHSRKVSLQLDKDNDMENIIESTLRAARGK